MKIRTLLPALLIMLLAAGICPAQTLRQAADQIGLLVGAAVNPRISTDSVYAATVAREYNMVEPENQMKWAATEPRQGEFNFGPGDAVVTFAEAHGIKVRGHNLLWAVYNPAWLKQGHFTPKQLRRIMKRHIQTEVKHYRGKVFAWDVVNEAINKDGSVKHSIWYDQPGIGLAGKGTEYIAQAFRWAHQADPKALLFYNDYDAEGLNAKSDAIYAMVKDFKQKGVPIDGVGLQMHLRLGRVPSGIAANIERLAKLGLQVHITEMDVGLPMDSQGQASAAELAGQARMYHEVAAICASHPDCTAFQTWGFTDKYSWIPGFTHGKFGAALVFNKAYEKKPAYDAIVSAFSAEAKAHPEIKAQRQQLAAR